MSRARVLVDAGQCGEALALLGDILRDAQDGGCEDYFVPNDGDSASYHSLKSEARRLIGEMPRSGRELYELQYGSEARRILDQAIESGDLPLLTKVSRCYFHTSAGGEAALLLGMCSIDQAHPLNGAILLQRLHDNHHGASRFEPVLSLSLASGWLQAGMPEKARQTLSDLKRTHPDVEVTIAGKQVPLFEVDLEAIDWLVKMVGPQPAAARNLDDWTMFRGDVSRNASTVASSPFLNLRWRARVCDDPLVGDILKQVRRIHVEQGVTTLSGLHPLAVDNVVLMRTWQNLQAVDFKTGLLVWVVRADSPPATLKTNLETVQQTQLEASIAGQRVWDDAIYGKLSSDGQRVFSIEGLNLKSSRPPSRLIVFGGVVRHAGSTSPPYNRLAAHDIRTGKLQWHLGGAAGDSALDQAGTFFLGPPLPLWGRLYVLGEIAGEIRLLALDGQTGKVLWTQQLVMVEREIRQDFQRRLAGATPSYADGILVCPTSNGAVVAVDLATRSLLWGYCYPKRNIFGLRFLPGLGLSRLSNGMSTGSWVDSTATVAGGRVLITPVESNSLYCVNLIDGTLAWEYERGQDLYVACVHQGNVVLVGRSQVRALRLSDGKPAWEGRTTELPEGGMPTGRGFTSGNRYFVPLSSAEVAVVDLDRGDVLSVAKSRKGNLPGNMICHQGNVYSQGSDGLSCFYQLDTAAKLAKERLAANPDDVAALMLWGESLLDRKENQKAIASLFQAFKLEDNPITRNVLRSALMDGLASDFPAHRQYADETEKLLESPEQKAAFLRLMAAGLRRSKQWQPAMEQYLKLVDFDVQRRADDKSVGLESHGKSYSVRRDRWVQTQLAKMREHADDQAAKVVDQAVGQRLQAVLKSNDREKLGRFLDYFDAQPGSEEVRSELISLLDRDGEQLAAELLSGRHKGAETAADEARVTWPAHVIDSKLKPNRSLRVSRKQYLPFVGNRGPFFSDATINWDQNKNTVTCLDGLGHHKWDVAVPRIPKQTSYSPSLNSYCVRADGHLLMLLLGGRLVAVDTLGKGEKASPRVLWQEDLTELGWDASGTAKTLLRTIGLRVNIRQIYTQNVANVLGPVTDHYTCFQRYRNLVAVDTLSGKHLWVRGSIPPGSSLFGDEKFVFVLPPNETEAMVFNALDGESLGKRRLPTFRAIGANGDHPRIVMNTTKWPERRLPFRLSCRATIGRLVLSWYQHEDGGHQMLELFDPWEQKHVWPPRKFSAKAKLGLVEHKVAGVVEPDGRFVMVSLPDGRTIAEQQLQPERDLTDITFLRCGDQYILVVHNKVRGKVDIRPMPMGVASPKMVAQGSVYALDLEGRLIWPQPATVSRQYMMTGQPTRLPVFTFACRVHDRRNVPGARPKVEILCLDKRTGREVYNESVPYTSANIEMVGDAKSKMVGLRMDRQSVALEFSDEPPPPPTTSRALWKAIGKAVDKSGP